MKQFEGFELRDDMIGLKFLKDHPVCYVEKGPYEVKSRNWAILSIQV